MGDAGFKMWRKSWWVVLFCLTTGFAYFDVVKEKKAALRELAFRLGEMEKEKILALQEKEDLQLRIASESDPSWIEMILMRDLGVVPEGFLKVHFTK
ncbi:MAG: hypothetical protein A3E80_03755 [Chlamydiae bacterium RIFCSPHIGHO2_12_FULL_49_9]|nr:MAG: hypothetical protein A3E80_03755 [Chlamydiae bacterium RIFCSPHIGHO2_12_FULL_49_9]